MKRHKNDGADAEAIAEAALRGHLAEFGLIAPTELRNVDRLKALIEEATDLPALATEMAQMHFERIGRLTEDIEALAKKVKTHCSASDDAHRLQSMPGIGPIAAMVIEAFAPDMHCFEKGRDFAAWLGLVPKQHSTGGKTRLGQTSKMGQKDIRRALTIGAMSRIAGHARQNSRAEPWLQDKLDRKPKMLAAVALANKMARQIWAMIVKQESYRPATPMAV